MSAVLLIEKGQFNGEMLSGKKAQEADMRMKQQTPTLLRRAQGSAALLGERGIACISSAPLSCVPLLLFRGPHASTHSRVQ